MRNRVRDLFDRVRQSLFFIPALIVGGCAVLARTLLWVDGSGSLDGLPVLSTTVASARVILSTIAGATITVAAIVFSITALTVQLAASQYSPRILGVLFRDRFQQIVIGIITGTFVYSLLVLGAVRLPSDGAEQSSPSVSTTAGITLAVLAMLLIVGFLNHVLQRIEVGTLIRGIADATTHEVRRELPERLEASPETALAADQLSGEPSLRVRGTTKGWVTYIDNRQLLDAVDDGGVLRVDVEVGDYVHSGTMLAAVWTLDPPSGLESAIREAIGTGTNRKIDGDPRFGLRLLSDIALRALSRGINDPATAVDVVTHLGEPLGEVLTRDLPHRVIGDRGDGRRLFRPDRPDRDDYIRSALQGIRLNAGAQPEVIRAIIDLAHNLVSLLPESQDGRGDSLRREVHLLLQQAERELPDDDVKLLRRRAEKHGLVPGPGD
jgi:uncharacterized membrane protein